MSGTIREQLIARAQISAPGWVDAGISAAVRAAHEASTKSGPMSASLVGAAALLDECREKAKGLTPALLYLATESIALGREDAARLEWLRSTATPEERLAARDEARRGTTTDREKREAAWTAAEAFGRDLLSRAGTIALPLLLSLL